MKQTHDECGGSPVNGDRRPGQAQLPDAVLSGHIRKTTPASVVCLFLLLTFVSNASAGMFGIKQDYQYLRNRSDTGYYLIERGEVVFQGGAKFINRKLRQLRKHHIKIVSYRLGTATNGERFIWVETLVQFEDNE